MKTTVEIDDDLMPVLRARACSQSTTLRNVINEVLRRGLAVGTVQRAAGQRYRCPVVSMGHSALAEIALEKSLAIAAALEDLEVARKLMAEERDTP